MLLSELTDKDRVLKLASLGKFIEHALEDEKHELKPWMQSKTDFLEFLAQNDIPISDDELEEIVSSKKGPLGKVIDNIQGDEIIWVGQGDEMEVQDGGIEGSQQNAQDEQIVANMAQQAMPK